MLIEPPPAKPSSESRMSLAIIIEPAQANAFGTLHGGVMLKLADECGAIAALRHAGKGQITTAAIDSMIFLGPGVRRRAGRDLGRDHLRGSNVDRNTNRDLRRADRGFRTTEGRGGLCTVCRARRDGTPASAESARC